MITLLQCLAPTIPCPGAVCLCFFEHFLNEKHLCSQHRVPLSLDDNEWDDVALRLQVKRDVNA